MTTVEDSQARVVVEAARAYAPDRGKRTRRLRTALWAAFRPAVWLPAVALLALLGWWWSSTAVSKPYLLPPLSDVFSSLTSNPEYYLSNAWITLSESLLGLGIAFVTSFVLAILISEIPLARRAIMPLAVVLNVTPLVALAPALVVAFGFGPEPKLIVTALICFFPILINVSTGLRSVDSAALHVFRTINASRLETLVFLRVPSSLPFVFTALRIVFPLSIIGAVVAELNAPGAAEGLGTAISLASSNNRLAVVYASIFVLALMGALLLLIVTAVERRALSWHESQMPSSS